MKDLNILATQHKNQFIKIDTDMILKHLNFSKSKQGTSSITR